MALRMAEVPVSRSTRIVRPCRESASAKLIANVVLPTPPLPDETGMIRLIGTFAPSLTKRRVRSRRSQFAGASKNHGRFRLHVLRSANCELHPRQVTIGD